LGSFSSEKRRQNDLRLASGRQKCHFQGAKVAQMKGKCTAVGTQVWDFCKAKVPHLQFRIHPLQSSQRKNRWNTATYRASSQKATNLRREELFRDDAILEVDTSVKVF